MKPTEVGHRERYRWFALAFLFLANLFHVIDRHVFAILQDSIKRDLKLSDTVLGLLGGLAFALFYAVLGLPIARLADRLNRTRIIAVSLFLWSGMTAVCGLATSALTLAFARLGVGVGEAGCSPATQSLIADYFQSDRRSTAFAILTAGTGLGFALGFLLGGTLDASLGWRGTFVALSVPGIVLSVFFWFGLREPPRDRLDRDQDDRHESLWGVLALLWKVPTFRWVLIAYSLHFFAVQGAGSWKISYFRRSFPGVAVSSLGSALAGAALFGIVGIMAGGLIADRLQRQDRRWLVWTPMLTIILAIPFYIIMLRTSDWHLAIGCYALDVGLNAAFTGPTLALMQDLVPPRMRARAAALVLLGVSLLGMGLGPLVVGVLSDALQPTYGPLGLRYALLSAIVINVLAIAAYARSTRSLRADLRAIS